MSIFRLSALGTKVCLHFFKIICISARGIPWVCPEYRPKQKAIIADIYVSLHLQRTVKYCKTRKKTLRFTYGAGKNGLLWPFSRILSIRNRVGNLIGNMNRFCWDFLNHLHSNDICIDKTRNSWVLLYLNPFYYSITYTYIPNMFTL